MICSPGIFPLDNFVIRNTEFKVDTMGGSGLRVAHGEGAHLDGIPLAIAFIMLKDRSCREWKLV